MHNQNSTRTSHASARSVSTRQRTGRLPHNRRGSLLIQMVVVMIGISAAMTVVGTLLARMFRHESIVLSTIAESSTTARMARLLRDDVHSALRVEASADGKTLTVQQATSQIVWSQRSPHELQRVRISVGEQRDPATIPGERFRIKNLESKFIVTDTVEATGSKSIVTLIATARPDPTGKSLARVNAKQLNARIVACVGLLL